MDPTPKAIFVDTNGFIQLRDLKDLPWNKLLPTVSAIDLMVASCVIRELDRHKSSTNRRLRDGARLALKMIEACLTSEPGHALPAARPPSRYGSSSTRPADLTGTLTLI